MPRVGVGCMRVEQEGHMRTMIQKMWNDLCLISFPYCAHKWTDVFGIECGVKFSLPVYLSLATFCGAPLVQDNSENHTHIFTEVRTSNLKQLKITIF
jgi:hypothetical protein